MEDLVEDTSSNRRQHNRTEQWVATRWQDRMQMLTECKGQELQRSRSFTAFKNTHYGPVGTRLDRFYSSHDLSPYIRTARVLQTSSSGIKSDHRPIILDLQGRNISPPATLERPKVKLPRVKCSFRLNRMYHWTLGQKTHPIKKYTVKLGTRLLSMEGQLERDDGYYRWLYGPPVLERM